GRSDAERVQPLADRMDDLPGPRLGGSCIEAGVDHKGAVRALDYPDVIGDRGHLIVRIAEDVILRAHAGVAGVTDGIDFVNIVAHDFFPMVTPARRSIICAMTVRSESPPNSALVVSH